MQYPCENHWIMLVFTRKLFNHFLCFLYANWNLFLPEYIFDTYLFNF